MKNGSERRMRSWHLDRCLVEVLAALILIALAPVRGASAQEVAVPDDIVFSAPAAPDLPIILENVADGGDKGCASLCMQILVKTTRPVIIDGVAYRRLEGAVCSLPEHAESVRGFVLAGYLGACAESTAVANTEDAIFVQATYIRPGNSRSGLLPAFAGLTMQAIERRRGTERILGRRTHGSIASPSIFSPLGFSTKRVGARFNEAAFLQQLLGVPMVKSLPESSIARDKNADMLIAALVPQLDLPDHRKAAVAAVVDLAGGLEYGDRTMLTGLLLDFLHSGSKGQTMGAFGMMRDISGWSAVERDAARPVIAAALQSEDAELVASALGALRRYSEPNRAFANPQLVALAFSPILRGEDHAVRAPLVLYIARMTEPAPAADRDRARAFLLQGSLTQNEVVALLALVAQGGGPARADAFALLQQLDQRAFEQGAAYIGVLGWKSFAGDPDRFWSGAEFDALFARMDAVPDERLEAYMHAFSGGGTSKERRQKVVDRVAARLAAAEAAGASFEATKPLRMALIRARMRQ